jgi:hypothetical protein
MGDLEKIGQSTDLVQKNEGSLAEERISGTGFQFANVMREKLGLVGKLQLTLEERRIARQEVKQVLAGQMRAHTQLLLRRAELDLEFLKQRDQAAHNVRVQRIETFLLQEEARLQHTLNDMIDKFEDEFTSQYMNVKSKLTADRESGKIDNEIFEQRIQRAARRYQDSMDKAAEDMLMVVNNHKGNLVRTLKNEVTV